jgi:hypothetical protein
MISRYCSFWAAARVAISSSHSPRWRVADAAEAVEGVEELIVAGLSGDRDESAHRKGVDELVVEVLIFGDGVGADAALAADRLGRNAARLGRWAW